MLAGIKSHEGVWRKKKRGPSQEEWEGKISNARIQLRSEVTAAKWRNNKWNTALESISCFATNFLSSLGNSESWFAYIHDKGVKLNKTKHSCHLKNLPNDFFSRKNTWLPTTTPVTYMLYALEKTSSPFWVSVNYSIKWWKYISSARYEKKLKNFYETALHHV